MAAISTSFDDRSTKVCDFITIVLLLMPYNSSKIVYRKKKQSKLKRQQQQAVMLDKTIESKEEPNSVRFCVT